MKETWRGEDITTTIFMRRADMEDIAHLRAIDTMTIV